MNNIILTMLAVLTLSGCVTTPKFNKLEKPNLTTYFILNESIYKQEVTGLMKGFSISGLKKGRYFSVAEDSSGTYYTCGKDCFILLAEDDARNYMEDDTLDRSSFKLGPGFFYGGLWVPKSGVNKKMRLFNVLQSPNIKGQGAIAAGVLAYEDGRIKFHKLDKELLQLESINIIESE